MPVWWRCRACRAGHSWMKAHRWNGLPAAFTSTTWVCASLTQQQGAWLCKYSFSLTIVGQLWVVRQVQLLQAALHAIRWPQLAEYACAALLSQLRRAAHILCDCSARKWQQDHSSRSPHWRAAGTQTGAGCAAAAFRPSSAAPGARHAGLQTTPAQAHRAFVFKELAHVRMSTSLMSKVCMHCWYTSGCLPGSPQCQWQPL